MLHWFSQDERWKLTIEGTVPLKKLLSYVYKASLVVDTDHHFLKLLDVTKCDEILSLVQGSKFSFGFGSTCATRCKFLGALPTF